MLSAANVQIKAPMPIWKHLFHRSQHTHAFSRRRSCAESNRWFKWFSKFLGAYFIVVFLVSFYFWGLRGLLEANLG